MSTKLILGPAAAGKTLRCIEKVRATARAYPLSEVWVVLPDSHQVTAFRRRLAEQGGAMGARIGTFADLHGEILAVAGEPMPVAPDAVVHRLALAAIDAAADKGRLVHYASIQRQPGLAVALIRLVAELKRARIEPATFQNAVQGRGPRLEELAWLYNEYQDSLIRLQWADVDGLGWLAVRALANNRRLASHWKLLVADGFDILYPTQLETLKLLSRQVDETVLTLTGDLEMKRDAYRRFKRGLEQIQQVLAPEIETLERRATTVPTLAHLEQSLFESGPPRLKPGAALSFVQAQTQGLEAREALRWLKARVQRDGIRLHECAVIARDLQPYRPFLRQASLEFGMPVWFAGGEPLVSNPAIAAILNLLELPIDGWQRRPMIDALRTPYFDRKPFGLSAIDAFRFDQVARWGQVVKGLDQWEEALTQLAQRTSAPSAPVEDDETTGPPPLVEGEEAQQCLERLRAFARAITPPAQATLVGFVGWLEDLLSATQGLAVIEQAEAQQDTAERDLAAIVALKDILRALVLGEKIVGEKGPMPYADFYTNLYSAVEAGTYCEDRQPPGQSRIYCASLRQARGVSYRAVAVLGLSEGLFPAPMDEDPFLPDSDREQLANKDMRIELRLRSDQQSSFYEAVTRASDYLLLTRPYLADDGETWVASPYWSAVLALYEKQEPRQVRTEDALSLSECASRVELLTAAVRRRSLPAVYTELIADWENLRYAGQILRARMARDYRGPLDGQLAALQAALAQHYGPTYLWSASSLETFAGCGFRFLVTYALALEELSTPEAGFDGAQLGSMLHAILEKVYQRASRPYNPEAVLQALPQAAEEVFATAPSQYGFRPLVIWDRQQAELVEQLEASLRNLAGEETEFRPTHFEKKFGSPPLEIETPSGPVLFHGTIDRVDVNSRGACRVIDYKTGMSKLDHRALGEGLRLQLALYALGAERALKLGRVVEGFYWGILKGEASSLRLSKFHFQEEDGKEYNGVRDAIELTLKHVLADIVKIRSGEYLPIPPRDNCPNYCAARSICWRYRASEY